MRTFARILAVAGLFCLAAGLGSAQPPRGGGRGGFGGPGGGMGGGALLTNKSVQQELKLTDEQAKKVDEAVKGVREKHQDDFQALRDLSPEERREKGGALMQKVSEETHKALAGVLRPEQEKRFKQIELQARGTQAFSEPEVQKHLKLTDDQQEKLKTIAEDAGKEMRSLFQGGGRGGNPEEARKKMAELRKETMDKAMSVLNADQKAQWKEMTGEPFEVRFEGQGGGRGGRGGRGGANRGGSGGTRD
jgi:Spy/CpxP family protein refolding chaperone